MLNAAIIARRRAALTYRVASRYLKADFLHNPKEMPEIGDRVLDMDFGEDGWIRMLFENGETLSLATGIHLGDAQDSDTKEWQEQRIQELATEGKQPDWSQRTARIADRYLERQRVARIAEWYANRQRADRIADRIADRYLAGR